MGIKKFLNIQNLWRFSLFNGKNDDLSLVKNTFIFGKNTHGKSTLTSIFRSLESWNNDFITWRKTFDSIWNQQISIEMDDWSTVLFDWTSWKNNNLKLKIFDTRYIIDNIYSDEKLDENKQKKIISIILWSKGKSLEKEYINAKIELDKNPEKKKEITRSYWLSFDKSSLSFDAFRKLTSTDCEGIDIKIGEIDKKIKSVSNQSQIIQILNEVSLIFQKVETANLSWLRETLIIDQERIKLHIAIHINDADKALDFLSKWFDLLEEKKDEWKRSCVFCGQELWEESEKLVLDFSTYFSEQYKKLNALVSAYLKAFNNWSITNDLLIKQPKLQELWLNLDFSDLIIEANKYRENLIEELNKKKDNLNYVINLEAYDSMKLLFSEFQKNNLESLILEHNGTIDRTEPIRLKTEKTKYEIIKKRNEKPWIDSCKEYNDLEKEFDEVLKPAEEKAFKDKNDYAKWTLDWYESSINSILEKLCASFRLTDFILPDKRRGELKLFSLKFNDCTSNISLDWAENQSNFKNTLSESDKRLLAFAFFVTDIKNTPDLKEYIVILDDPMSSFDSERKNTTIKVLRDELTNGEWEPPDQLIVLTHEDNFFRFLNDIFQDQEKKFLKVVYSWADKTSKIHSCDIDEEFLKDEHFKNLDYYRNIQSWRDYSWCELWRVRIILEHIIDRKHYIDITTDIRSRWWILNWYYTNTADTILKTKMIDLFPNISHHDQSTRIKEWDLSDGDKQDIVKNLFEIVKML